MVDDLVSGLNRQYLKVRQQYRHLQACTAYLTGAPLASPRFVLFGRGRSGTSLLISLLDAIPSLHCEDEILHDYVPFPHVHVLGRNARSGGGGYGFKLLSYQVRDVQTALDAPRRFLRTLHHDDGFQVLYLRRTNLLRHALSNIRARRDTFHRTGDEDAPSRPALHVDPEHVVDWMRSSEALATYEHELLDGVPHLSLTYEDNLRDPEAHQSTVDTVCAYLGIPSASVETTHQKLAPRSLRAGVENYDELARHLRDTPYEQYLND
jgi:LPS sulfotransferase NodH